MPETTTTTSREPSYSELPTLPDSEERHAWDVWGRDDQIGSANWLGPEQVAYASTLVKSGTVVNLTLPLTEPNPGLFPNRTVYQHTITTTGHGRDDRLDGLYPQFGSQWDSLRHVRYRQHGYWGGRQDEEIDRDGLLGVERWAEHGLIGRGVLLDMKAHLEGKGETLAPDVRRGFQPSTLDEVAKAEGVELRRGDLVLVRTGWVGWYRTLDEAKRADMRGSVGREPDPFACPGLESSQEMAAWLWDNRVTAIASDNVAVEALPVVRPGGFFHYRMIPLLGLAVGEMWQLDGLSDACAKAGRYEFLLASAVLNIPGGVGSPANAYAVL